MTKFEMDFSGIDKLQENLEQIDEVNGILLIELLGEELFEKITSNFSVETEEDFNRLSENELDKYISNITDYKTYQELLEEKYAEYILKKLFS